MWSAAVAWEGMAPSLAVPRRHLPKTLSYTVTLSPAVYPPATEPDMVASW
jgi:hypothetical protein